MHLIRKHLKPTITSISFKKNSNMSHFLFIVAFNIACYLIAALNSQLQNYWHPLRKSVKRIALNDSSATTKNSICGQFFFAIAKFFFFFIYTEK